MEITEKTGEFKVVFLDDKESPTPFESLKQATEYFVSRIKEMIKSGGMALQVLETCIWIEVPGRKIPMFFYEVKNHAIDEGWLKDGKWVG